jgi:hypothetical protein
MITIPEPPFTAPPLLEGEQAPEEPPPPPVFDCTCHTICPETCAAHDPGHYPPEAPPPPVPPACEFH